MATGTPTLSPAAVAALSDAAITGHQLVLVGQLDRKVYVEVNAVLERIGGKWNRKAKAHIFAGDPREALASVLDGGRMPVDKDKEAAFWRTPPAVAERLLAKAGVYDSERSARILEPSAGDGAIADAIIAATRADALHVQLACIEPDAGRHATLVGKGLTAHRMTFEDFVASGAGVDGVDDERFDAIVMNPPFATAGHPVLWAEHVLLAWDLLADGGVLSAVVPNNITREHRIAKEVKALVDTYGDFEPLPDDSFKLSGTNVRTGILTLWR